MSYQTNKTTYFVFDGHVSYVAPVHNAGREIYQVGWSQSEQIGGHKLSDRLVALTPVVQFAGFGQFPIVHRFALLLTSKNC